MNSALEIRHITGSSYHPQSQGMVESLHKTMNGVVRGLVSDHPEDWESRVPFAECILRIVPLKALGGRSPYEVVTGLKPRLPRSLDVTQVIESVDINEYVARLTQYFRDTYRDVEGIQKEQVEKRETTLDGYLSSELHVGDVVAIRREASARRDGPLRFQQRTYPDLYRVKAKVGTHTVTVESVSDPTAAVPVLQPVNADRLVRVDLPELALDPSSPRRLEIYETTTDSWRPWNVEKFSVDGRVRLRDAGDVSRVSWFDLSTVKYRWLA